MRIRILLLLCMLCGASSAQAGEDNVHLRVLAASCAACHGTSGNSVGGTPVLAGLDPSHFMAQMLAFRSGTRESTVMRQHAKGLGEDEMTQLAVYFGSLPRKAASSPLPLGEGW